MVFNLPSSRKRNPNWCRDELILALDFYLSKRGAIPGKSSAAIAELSQNVTAVGRKAGLQGNSEFRNRNGVYMKLMNFRRLDPQYRGKPGEGLRRGGKLEAALWDEVSGDPQKCRKLAEALLRK
jgi:predicted HNH restriction endonuclease